MRILLVDDEPSLLSLLTQYLTRQGHEVRTAGTCAAATAALLEEGPLDAAIIDLTLPDGNGEDIARQCAARHPEARIVIATGYDYTAPTTTWTVLQKPFLPRALLHILG